MRLPLVHQRDKVSFLAFEVFARKVVSSFFHGNVDALQVRLACLEICFSTFDFFPLKRFFTYTYISLHFIEQRMASQKNQKSTFVRVEVTDQICSHSQRPRKYETMVSSNTSLWQIVHEALSHFNCKLSPSAVDIRLRGRYLHDIPKSLLNDSLSTCRNILAKKDNDDILLTAKNLIQFSLCIGVKYSCPGCGKAVYCCLGYGRDETYIYQVTGQPNLDRFGDYGGTILYKLGDTYQCAGCWRANNYKALWEYHGQRIAEKECDLVLGEADSRRKERKELLKLWMVQTVQLPEYFELFVENGLEELDVVKDIDDKILTEIGIKKVGHRMKLLKHIQSLRHDGQRL